MAAQWYYSKGGQQMGPVEQHELQGLIASGQVHSQDMVWREGMGSWQAASSVAELGRPAAGQAPVYAPPPSAAAPGVVQPLQYAQPVQDDPNAKKARTAFILSLVGLLCFGLILGIVAIVFAVQAQNGMRQTGVYKNKGLAIAAIVIGVIDIVSWAGIMAARFS